MFSSSSVQLQKNTKPYAQLCFINIVTGNQRKSCGEVCVCCQCWIYSYQRKMAQTVISAKYPPHIDPTRTPLAYGDRALPRLVRFFNKFSLNDDRGNAGSNVEHLQSVSRTVIFSVNLFCIIILQRTLINFTFIYMMQ